MVTLVPSERGGDEAGDDRDRCERGRRQHGSHHDAGLAPGLELSGRNVIGRARLGRRAAQFAAEACTA